MILGLAGKLLITRRFPMHKKYVVRLSDDERGVCQEIIKHLKGSSQKFRRAQMLLKADADGPGWPDVRIDGQMSGLPMLSTAARKRSRISANAWLRKALHGLWRARNAGNRPRRARSMARRKRRGLPCGWGNRRRVMDTGPCHGSPTHWWPWQSSMRSVTRRSVRY